MADQAIQACSEIEPDRFSTLPDELIHHILSFLNIDDILRATCLSKRWRDLCLLNSSITIDSSLIRQSGIDPSDITKSLYLFLFRRGYVKITSLCMVWSSFYLSYRAVIYLLYSFACEVEEIKLRLMENTDIYSLPRELYRCQSLRSLSLDLGYGSVKFPSTFTFTNLEHLHLKDMKIHDGFGEWISTCRTIKKLYLEETYGMENINIESSSLELFELINDSNSRLVNISVSGDRIESLSVQWNFNSSTGKLLRFRTPNLKYFRWSGNFVSQITMQNLLHLESAVLSLIPAKEYTSPISCNLLGSVESTKTLHIDGETIMDLYEHGCLTRPSYDVQNLFIHVNEDEDLNVTFFPPAIVSLLTGVHNLKTLCIQGENSDNKRSLLPFEGCGLDTRYWESQNLPCFDELEKVKLAVFNGGNELELGKYLLKHAKYLKEMIIFHFASLPSHVNERLNQFKLASDQMASIVVFKTK
ncbi:putative F-box/FBD/LRR-repeat protein At4g03220 [Ricinus communis]|uniref:F-box domain-containing protein n=1 Tax=Ricinus communis TaxID=3988 RepID=B9S0K5_RICCO|nr:putative F-box/FBD/LRR-repeat protein At4g03220 [Ricinus communis]EEF42938.1 conserved hypothetical protein [Ricinus communis]